MNILSKNKNHNSPNSKKVKIIGGKLFRPIDPQKFESNINSPASTRVSRPVTQQKSSRNVMRRQLRTANDTVMLAHDKQSDTDL